MTTVFAADAGNDLFVGEDGNLVIRTGLEAVLQACEHAAKTIQGEMIYATDQGLPYFETAWTGAPNRLQFEAYLRRALLAVEGVTDINELQTRVADNVLSYRVVLVTIYGIGAVNG